jgi:hypothetical protein
VEEWTDQYLSSPTAFTIHGRPVCSFLNLTDFAACYGTATFGIMLHYAGVTIERRIGRRPFLLGLIGQVGVTNLALANALPIDGVTGYGLLPSWLSDPVQEYSSLIRKRVAEWHWFQARLNRPFFPVVCTGWDASMRGAYLGRLTSRDRYPHSPVVTGTSPALFGQFLDEALNFNELWHPDYDVVFLHAWNEWSECSVLEPNDRVGNALLEQVRERANSGAANGFGLLRPNGSVAGREGNHST